MPSHDFADLLRCFEARAEKSLEPGASVLIFGAGRFGRDLCKAMQAQGHTVLGFVETAPAATEVLGLPVMNWEQSRSHQGHARLLLGIFNRGIAMGELASIAHAAGWSELVMPWQIYDAFGDHLGWRFWLGSREDLLANLKRVESVSARLADAGSREIVRRICAFRLGVDLDYAGCISDEPQYFNALTLPALPARKLCYVDCGAYNGDTFHAFGRAANCGEAYLFEPDPANFRSLCAAVRSTPAVCLPLAVSDSYSILSFNAGDGEGGAIVATGNAHIAAAALDDMLPGTSVDFLKLDVEGAEAIALRGARELITRSRPVIAMSLYHKQQDLWELPELLFEFCPDYRFHVRQHFYNSFDSVLYAVPER